MSPEHAITATDALSLWPTGLDPLLAAALFARALGLLAVAPVLGDAAIPWRVRIALAILLALALQPMLPPGVTGGMGTAAALGAINASLSAPPAALLTVMLTVLQEAALGAALGFMVRGVFAAVAMAGELVGLQMGVGLASWFDPDSAQTEGAVGRLWGTVVAWLFVVGGGHLLVLAGLARSVQAWPPGTPLGHALQRLQPVQWGAEWLATALTLAAPLLGVLWVGQLTLGLAQRAAPHLNLSSIGPALMLVAGLVGLALTLPLLHAPWMAVLTHTLNVLR